MTTDFDDIRPYNDDEVRPVLDRILADPELAQAIVKLRCPQLQSWLGWLLRPLVNARLTRELAGVNSVRGVQQVVEKYMSGMIKTTTTQLTVSGLEKLDPQQAYLFISNHRDITLDPAFVNWTLYHNDCNTLRIAIGDNLLSKPYVSDLMRLNKSFIVNRSAKAPREKLKAAKHLSAYIHHSIVNEQSSIWIAQREGRAKDGFDKTNPAVLSMITLNKPKGEALAGYTKQLRIVPVSISYELDPCDAAKANELHQLRTLGSYQKEAQEDIKSIAAGIAGQKGHIHLAFGKVLEADYPDVDALVEDLDREILGNYVLHASNCFAYESLQGVAPEVNYGHPAKAFNGGAGLAQARADFNARIQAMPEAHREIALAIYANPVVSKLAHVD